MGIIEAKERQAFLARAQYGQPGKSLTKLAGFDDPMQTDAGYAPAQCDPLIGEESVMLHPNTQTLHRPQSEMKG